MGTCFVDGSHKSWGVRYVNKLLFGRYWQLGFTVGVSQREKAGEVATCSFGFQGELQSVPKCELIRS